MSCTGLLYNNKNILCVLLQISSGEDAESSTDSSGTDYEPVEGDNLYEDPDTLDALNGKKKKLEEKVDSSKSLGNKLKKNYGKATNYLNKKFNQKKKSKVCDHVNVLCEVMCVWVLLVCVYV